MRKNATVKSVKTKTINIRVSEKEKEKFFADAEGLGMNFSSYVLSLLRHGVINKIEGGEELAHEIYRLNCNLETFKNYSVVPVQELKDVATEGLKRITNCMR